MSEHSGVLKVLAGAAGVTLVLGLGASVGAVPRTGEGDVRTASVVEVIEKQGDSAVAQPGNVPAKPVEQPQPTTTVAPAPAPTRAPVTTAPKAAKPATTPTTKAPSAPRTASAPAPAPTAAAPAPTVAPAAPVKVARRTPSPAEVQSAIGQLKQLVGGLLMFVSPTPEQIAQAGDQICTAFDNGQTFAQVKAAGLSMIPASITVSPATVDWAVRQAVTLYCPGHLAKLV